MTFSQHPQNLDRLQFDNMREHVEETGIGHFLLWIDISKTLSKLSQTLVEKYDAKKRMFYI
ncbi:hypothetical protein CDL12_18087 [Handroanthus impetiginosus]|uniref:Uncharacterized protein n=1 Tax=Handroanthus impetiginosus TaxID=429701 RepID=A0A2G9GVN1_9LAMI|nr:hypothetical protein CDL12_18087 [Handroanthus impetiginosus]